MICKACMPVALATPNWAIKFDRLMDYTIVLNKSIAVIQESVTFI